MGQITIGVLALQGGFHEHMCMLMKATQDLDKTAASTGKSRPDHVTYDIVEVRTPEQLASCDGLIIPGGQSTSIARLVEWTGLLEPLRDFVRIQHKPTLGTCAGLILLANELYDPLDNSQQADSGLIGGMDVQVQRNFFGRSDRTFEAAMNLPLFGEGEQFKALFIDAPVVRSVISARSQSADGNEVEVLAQIPTRSAGLGESNTHGSKDVDGVSLIVAASQGNIWGTSIHPELGSDTRFHEAWLRLVVANTLEKWRHY